MAVFRVEKSRGYTVMSNHHLRNKELSLKAKGLLSQMLSLPEDWDYTLAGCPISIGKVSTRSAPPYGSLKKPIYHKAAGTRRKGQNGGNRVHHL